jgi:predicted NACHT family NTPase
VVDPKFALITQLICCGITESAKTLLSKGYALVLLDGLDELRDVDHDRVLSVIKDFARQYRDYLPDCRTGVYI